MKTARNIVPKCKDSVEINNRRIVVIAGLWINILSVRFQNDIINLE